jgi:hypothetical protein
LTHVVSSPHEPAAGNARRRIGWWDLERTDAQRAELDDQLGRQDLRRAMAELIVARDRAAVRQEYWHGRYDELAAPIAAAAGERFKARVARGEI